jgi:dimethylhistidine N-methyltransferase
VVRKFTVGRPGSLGGAEGPRDKRQITQTNRWRSALGSSAAVTFYDQHPGDASLREEVLRGMASTPKAVAPKFFYDQRGSQLFDAICELPEYYLTRTEVAILRARAREITRLAGPGALLIELGSGASKKVRLLLNALRPRAYFGIDISRDFLLQSSRRLAADYPWLEVHALCADFSQPLNLARRPEDGTRLAFFPGSSIGNFDPTEAELFLKGLHALLDSHGALLIGVDLKKDTGLLNSAYNDAQGITAAFNLNLLRRIRRELDTDIDPGDFDHRAFYDERRGRIEMHLVSRRHQRVTVEDQVFELQTGETIHTENSYKYTVGEFHDLAQRAGYQPEQVWTDEQQLFSVHYLRSFDPESRGASWSPYPEAFIKHQT